MIKIIPYLKLCNYEGTGIAPLVRDFLGRYGDNIDFEGIVDLKDETAAGILRAFRHLSLSWARDKFFTLASLLSEKCSFLVLSEIIAVIETFIPFTKEEDNRVKALIEICVKRNPLSAGNCEALMVQNFAVQNEVLRSKNDSVFVNSIREFTDKHRINSINAEESMVATSDAEVRPKNGIPDRNSATVKRDFFVSYNKADKQWAEWIAAVLEDAGYSVLIQSWDIRPGSNFIVEMQKGSASTERTIIVLSEAYLNAEYTPSEWAAAFAKDPQGIKRLLIPIRVGMCKPEGLLGQIVYVDLVDLAEEDARIAVLGAFSSRAKPEQPPVYPGLRNIANFAGQSQSGFPGSTTATNITSNIIGGEGAVTSHGASAQQCGSSVVKTASVTAKERLELNRKLNDLLPQLFNMLVFALNPPPGVIPPMPSAQGDRTSALLMWAERAGGCGLQQVRETLELILQT